MAGGWGLWLRCSWRDLKRRWLQLTLTAFVIALGTGLFAGLSSVSRWRMMSNDASFGVTRFHDLHARLGAGNFVPAGELAGAAATLTVRTSQRWQSGSWSRRKSR